MYAAELRRLLRQGALTNQRLERTLPQEEDGRLRSAALNLKIFDFDAAERVPQPIRVASVLLGQIRGEILESGCRLLSLCSSSHIFQHFFSSVDARMEMDSPAFRYDQRSTAAHMESKLKTPCMRRSCVVCCGKVR